MINQSMNPELLPTVVVVFWWMVWVGFLRIFVLKLVMFCPGPWDFWWATPKFSIFSGGLTSRLMIQRLTVWSDFDMLVVEKNVHYIVLTSLMIRRHVTCLLSIHIYIEYIYIYHQYRHVKFCFPRTSTYSWKVRHTVWTACQVQCWRMLKGIIFGYPSPETNSKRSWKHHVWEAMFV